MVDAFHLSTLRETGADSARSDGFVVLVSDGNDLGRAQYPLPALVAIADDGEDFAFPAPGLGFGFDDPGKADNGLAIGELDLFYAVFFQEAHEFAVGGAKAFEHPAAGFVQGLFFFGDVVEDVFEGVEYREEPQEDGVLARRGVFFFFVQGPFQVDDGPLEGD